MNKEVKEKEVKENQALEQQQNILYLSKKASIKMPLLLTLVSFHFL